MGLDDLAAKAEAGSTVAQTVLGISLLESRDYPGALRWLTAAAENGASRAMVHLGRMFEAGFEVAVDLSRARGLYERAAERGEFLACVLLARLLASGQGGNLDQIGALRWYREALSHSGVEDCPELEEARAFVAARAE